MPESPRLGIIGFGEVGYYTAKGLKASGFGDICAYNSGHHHRPPYSQQYRQRAEEVGVTLMDSLADLAGRCQIILSSTSPATAVEVARQAAPFLGPGHLYVDINSCGPRIKVEAATHIEAAGARLLDACLLASPASSLHKGLTYLSGPGAEDFQGAFAPYGMDLEVISGGKVGDAALLKMLRSIITKGTMTVLWELTYAAYKCGVDLHQFERALGGFRGDFFASAERIVGYGYFHARRRAEESHEMQETLREYGVDPFLAEAYEKRFGWAAHWEEELRQRFGNDAIPSALEVVKAIEALERQATHAVSP